MKIQRVHILSSILAFVFSGAVVFFTSQNQNYSNLDEPEVKLPEVFEQSTGQVELEFKAEPNAVKVGEKSKIKLILKNKGTASIKDMIYKITVPEQFSIVKDSIPASGLINKDFGIFLSGVEVKDNDITFYMVNYPSVDTNSFLPNGLELISFDVTAKDTAITGTYQINFASNFTNQMLDLARNNILGKVTSADLMVIDANITIEKPIVNPTVSTSYNPTITFSGTKPVGTGIVYKLNDYNLNLPVGGETDQLIWSDDYSIDRMGLNTLLFFAYKGKNVSEGVKVEIELHGVADIRVDADSNGNSIVDARDLAVFAGSFYQYKNDADGKIEITDPSGYRLSDMNKVINGTTTTYGDGKIDAKDISEFIKNWKKSYKY